MTDILTPDRSPPNSNRIKIRPKSQQGIRNYSNVNLHAGLDIVKVYSGYIYLKLNIGKLINIYYDHNLKIILYKLHVGHTINKFKLIIIQAK